MYSVMEEVDMEQIEKRLEELRRINQELNQQLQRLDQQKQQVIQQIIMNNGAISELERLIREEAEKTEK